ncbi:MULTISPECIES: putative RNA methyltransferase [unclassified Pseudomonas]|uniref:putative RNA methyltransferase n=1 Tax=unclassified Pseudomonas TaxID=196821 RepID=UPI000BD499A6|nr:MULTISPECIES: methyltransferase domain-containing protein [unclassified Pseudomonas]PVZ20779.1 23S rRNA (guanine745-N1)-methyltransferase [Pseudomonas sp. URIL14HWK12:I12]PVZ27845.1 23S rRNA (guanine745-N1)-methyltransferase [Pseudomonas sp. URIL14HWK12:I10]PVZ38734.1 23S rRNA (guanine745-N1)-methyltransferase [Pseudomonas sp. URIL14HWK12:I11]SNZ02221.1 23S rRNA m(1)G-745 methyltransferase [Pseudomonas sp. URIL14HWK12:I9]
MLTCPLCSAPLASAENGVACPAGHRFDRARQGYLNLLPVQHKNSRAPGDNQAMVEARRAFLEEGHYAPVARRLAELAAGYAPKRWVDIGCGEGYYSAQLAEALPGSDGYALDISREAVKRACKRAQGVTWLVASMARIPLPSASCQLLTSVFSPLDWAETQRLLAPGGGLLRVGPTRDHLMELRQRLYDEVREYIDDKHLAQVPAGMAHAHSETLTYTLKLIAPDSRAALMAMTPHGWRASAERRAAVIERPGPFSVTVSMRYDYFVAH